MIWNHHHGYWPSNTESTKLSYITVVFLLCKPLTPPNRTSANFLHEKPSCTEENLIHLPVGFSSFRVSTLSEHPKWNLSRWSLVVFLDIFLGFQSYQTSNLVALGCLGGTATPSPAFLSGDGINISKQKNPLHPWNKHLPPVCFNKQRYTNHSINHPRNHPTNHPICLEFCSGPKWVFLMVFFGVETTPQKLSEWVSPPETETATTSTRSGTGGAVHENRPPSSSSSKSKSMKWRPLQKQKWQKEASFLGKIMVDSFF